MDRLFSSVSTVFGSTRVFLPFLSDRTLVSLPFQTGIETRHPPPIERRNSLVVKGGATGAMASQRLLFVAPSPRVAMASSNHTFKTREDFKKQKEIDQARKDGLIPAAVDEDGREINPHIPQYMTNAPWYISTEGPVRRGVRTSGVEVANELSRDAWNGNAKEGTERLTGRCASCTHRGVPQSLKHQRNWKKGLHTQAGEWVPRGQKGHQANKYRKGACENCGAMTHKTKECVERPRRKGAKLSNAEIAPDEVVQDVVLDYEGKRDRWNGYDAEEYDQVVERYEQVEKYKRERAKAKHLEKLKRRAQREAAGERASSSSSSSSSSESEGEDEDETKLKETEEAGFGQVKMRIRTTGGGATGSVRNLRIREDTAKYLINLDENSAHYDPKTRAMRGDPNPQKDPKKGFFHGDNLVRGSGEVADFRSLNMHIQEAQEKGQDVHMQAAPSQAEMLHAAFRERKAKLMEENKRRLLEKYGSAAGSKPDEIAGLGQTETYVEYDRAGHVVKGSQPVVKSRWEEDVFPGNHTSVWGSYWEDGAWGYACCHQTAKNAYCTGKAGIKASKANQEMLSEMRRLEAEKRGKGTGTDKPATGYKPSNTWGESGGHVELDPGKLEEAIIAAKNKQASKDAEDAEEKKRKFNVVYDDDTTEEQMEAYRITRERGEDPMKDPKAKGNDGYKLV